MLKLNAEHLETIHRHAAADYPAECCGVLLGSEVRDTKVVAEVTPLANLRHDAARAQELVPLDNPGRESERNRYLIDPREQLRVEKDARARGLTVLGYYHSHPDHPSRPSEYDREHAWPWYSYLIVAVEKGTPRDSRSWVLSSDRSDFHLEWLEEVRTAPGDRTPVRAKSD
jgi:proteasome lid subunit RPN8/RPN11